MRTPWLVLLGGLATACGGNFSNDDLEFLNALPAREELTARVPERRDAAQAPRTRALTDALLAVGDPSQLYEDTHQASTRFNTALEGLLSMLEDLRQQPPTTRAPDQRIWGPAEAPDHPALLVRFRMAREGDRFTYQLEYRPRGKVSEDWWPFVEGTFEATGGLRRGTGTVSVQVGTARTHGIEVGGFSGYKRLDVVYQTREPPLSVAMDFVPAAATKPALRYTYRLAPSGLGEMTYRIEDTDALPGNKRGDLFITSRWTREHGGKAVAVATGGNLPEGTDATWVECWDAGLRLTYFKRGWESGTVGSAAACPDVTELGY